MLRWRLGLASMVLFAAARAAAQTDAGGCGSVTAQGSCSGAVLSYCDTTSQSVVSYDCTQQFRASSQCVEIDPLTGSRCAEAPGESCLFQGPGSTILELFCRGEQAGCLEHTNVAECARNLGTCTATAVGSCRGDRLVDHCRGTQPYLIDCDSYLGHCRERACRDVQAGGLCDRQTFFCAPDLECRLGFCFPTSLPDGGVEDSGEVADAGARDASPAPEDSGGCACSASHPRQPAPSGRALAALALLLALRGGSPRRPRWRR